MNLETSKCKASKFNVFRIFVFSNDMKMNCIRMLSVFIFLCSCSNNSINQNAQIKFISYEHNFEELERGKGYEHVFDYYNPGETPVVISEVKTSCGCTGVDWTKKPVKPGKEGHVTIKYDASFPGTFEKTITVHYNGKDSPVLLKIRGKVAYPEDMEDLAE